MSEYIYAGSTSQSIDVFLQDSSSTTGAGLTGLVYNSSGLTAYYRKGATGSPVAISLQSRTLGQAWASGGFCEVDATNMPGVYRLDLPDLMVDTAGYVTLYLRGATNLLQTAVRIQCGTIAADVRQLNGSAQNADRMPISDTAQRTIKITGSNHVAADIHETQPDSIHEEAFDTDAISARVIATDAIDDDALADSAVTTIQSGLATAANQTTILARLGAFTGTGVNTVLGFLRAMTNKAASTPSDIGGTYSATTDALEAIRDAQAAGTGDASQATLEAVQDTVDAIAARVSGGLIEVTSRVAQGGLLLLYIGDDARVRSGTEIEITISDVGGAIYARLDSLGAAALAFGASRRGLAAGAISGTISGLSQAGSGSAQTVTLVVEIDNVGEGLQPLDDYVWQIVSTSSSGDEWVEVEGTLELRRRVAIPV